MAEIDRISNSLNSMDILYSCCEDDMNEDAKNITTTKSILGKKPPKFENGQGCFSHKDCKSKICVSCPLANQCGLGIGQPCKTNKDCCSLICLHGKCAMKPRPNPRPKGH